MFGKRWRGSNRVPSGVPYMGLRIAGSHPGGEALFILASKRVPSRGGSLGAVG